MIHLNINCKKHHKILALFILLLPLGFSTAWAQTTYRFDYTYKVGTDKDSWHGLGMAGTGVAPAVTTANGLNVQMAERYEGNTPTNDGNNDNGKLYQEVSGLPNGTYEVKLYANACRANVGTFDGNCNVQVYAGNVTQRVTPQNRDAVTSNGEYTLSNVSVTNGTLKIGLRKTSSGTNWYTIQIKSLTRISTNPDGFLRMKNVQSGGSNYYLGTSGNNYQSGQPYLKTKQNPGDDGIWYLETTGNGYHLIHVSDCKRVVTNSNNQTNQVVHLETTNTGSVYTIVTHTNGSNSGIIICPQGSISQSFNQWGGNGGDIGWFGDNSSGSYWTFENVSYSMDAPTITFDNNTNNVTISHTNNSANIYYTLDGYDPSDASTAYSNSFSQTTPVTVKAVAYGCIVHSSVAQLQIIKVATPTIADIQSNQITITTTTPGATIYYKTTEAGTYQQYTSPISATGISQIWAYAKKDNCINSDVANRILTTPTVLAFASNALTMTSTTLSLPGVSLTAEGNPISGTITYSSNNTGCVSVNSTTGELTINGAGTAIITASYAGDATYSPSSATMTITVANTDALDETVLSDMTITPSSQTLDLGGQVTYTASESLNNIHRTCQAYTTITTNGNNYYKVGDNYQAVKPTTNEDGTPVRFTSFNWSAEEGTAYFALDQYYSATSNQVTLTRSEQKTASNHSYTITVTGVYGGQYKTATATVTIPATWVDLTALHAGEALNLGIGESGTLEGHYTWEPNYDAAGASYKKFTYTSSDINVATVGADGNVTAVGAGSTTITIQSKKMDGTNGVSCDITVYVSVDAPTISIDASGYVTITPPIAGLQIRYTTDGSNPTATTGDVYSGPFGPVSNETVVKAVTVSNSTASSVASKQYITTGISGSKVIINDLEDHTWTYYAGVNSSIDENTGTESFNQKYLYKMYSPDPRNVKITYKGGSVSGASDVAISGESGEGQNTMVYFKTLEKYVPGEYVDTYNDGIPDNTTTTASEQYPYTVISNPFSKRPKTTSAYYGFAGWKVTKGWTYIRRADGTTATQNAVLNLDEKIHFQNLPYTDTNCISAEIEFEATWAEANVQSSSSVPNFTGGTYETNLWVLTGDFNGTINKPCTMMAKNPDGTAGNYDNYTINGGIQVGCDGVVKIEWVKNSATIGESSYNNNDQDVKYNTYWDANGHDFYVGRGVAAASSSATMALSGSNTDQTCTNTVKVESGVFSQVYNYREDHSSNTLNQIFVYGCDYDRAKNDNTKLKIGDIRTSNQTHGNKSRLGGELYARGTIKSGSYMVRCGSDERTGCDTKSSGYNGDVRQNIYYHKYGEFGCRMLTVEGGHISGGITMGSEYGGSDSRQSNDQTSRQDASLAVRLRIRGTAEIEGLINGAASANNSSGNRVIVVTGGTMSGWIAGGCNGNKNASGINYGASFIYVGGNAIVDSKEFSGIHNNMGHSSGGAIYGAGCGNRQGATSGSMNEGSNVVLADNAYVERGIYGGGALGKNEKLATIYITGGRVGTGVGSILDNEASIGNIPAGVFGGSCYRDGADAHIYMYGGVVESGIYGGSNVKGNMTKDTKICINGGQVGKDATHTANVHGGGLGNETRVIGNVDVAVGKRNATTGTLIVGSAVIYGDVYGGSAQGKTNGNTALTSGAKTNVTLNAGTINGALYGGGLGTSAYAADVYGPVQVTVNGGEVDNVFGCNNVKGSPKSTVSVTMTDGEVNECVYGGGNAAAYTGTPEVTVEGGKVHQHVFGGGLGSGAIITGNTRVTIQGTAHIHGNVYGGGNGGLVTGNTHVDIK